MTSKKQLKENNVTKEMMLSIIKKRLLIVMDNITYKPRV